VALVFILIDRVSVLTNGLGETFHESYWVLFTVKETESRSVIKHRRTTKRFSGHVEVLV